LILSNEPDPEEQAKLWAFCQKWMHTICERYIANGDQEEIGGIVEVLSFVISKFKGEDLQKKMTKFFLEMNDSFPKHLPLTVLLMKNSIISIQEWDIHIS
jgi:CCR4-NOT transcription complex subunit 1